MQMRLAPFVAVYCMHLSHSIPTYAVQVQTVAGEGPRVKLAQLLRRHCGKSRTFRVLAEQPLTHLLPIHSAFAQQSHPAQSLNSSRGVQTTCLNHAGFSPAAIAHSAGLCCHFAPACPV